MYEIIPGITEIARKSSDDSIPRITKWRSVTLPGWSTVNTVITTSRVRFVIWNWSYNMFYSDFVTLSVLNT